MSRSEPQNLFELEGLEQRILLSGDPLFGALYISAPDELDPAVDIGIEYLPVEEILVSGENTPQNQSTSNSSEYNPADNLDGIFAGMSDEDDQSAFENDPPSNQLSCESAATDLQSSQNSPDHFITEGEETAITNGLEDLANLGALLENDNDFAAVLPITDDASLGGIFGLYEILDTRLKTPVYDYFNDATDPPTTDGFLTTLQDISGTFGDLSITTAGLTGGYNADDSEICFTLEYGAARDGVVCLDAEANSVNVFDPTSLELSVNPEIAPVSSQFSKTSDNAQASSLEGETLDLPGLRLVDPDTSCFNGQVFWLNFEGAEDVTYNGPVTIEHIDIPAFKAPDSFAGREQEIISKVLAQLMDSFAPTGLTFTTDKPGVTTEYSTIYIGGDSSAFAEHGIFNGLAEAVDVGNRNPADNAFVFTETFAAQHVDLSSCVNALTATAQHEAAHLLGYAHDCESVDGGILGSVAETASYTTSKWGGDGVWTSADQAKGVSWTLSGFPSDAKVTSVKAEWNIDANWVEDVKVYSQSEGGWRSSNFDVDGDGTTWGDWGDGYDQTSEQSQTWSVSGSFSEVKMNQKWKFFGYDYVNDGGGKYDSGRVDWAKLTLYYTYTSPKPDLHISDFDCENEGWRWGTTAQVDIDIYNEGNANADNVDIWLIASNDSTLGDSDDYTIKTWYNQDINAYQHWTQSNYTWGLPESPYSNMPNSGTVHYFVRVETASGETDTGDNYSSDSVTMHPAEEGEIVSVSPSTFIGGQSTTVTVRVHNTGLSDDMIVEWDSKPSDGWSISPKNRNPYINSGDTYDAQFTVTPPLSGGSGTIVWKFYDDDLGYHPSGSDLLDTENQSVSATPAQQINWARWENSSGTELTGTYEAGTTVYLVVSATGYSTGTQFTADIFEAEVGTDNQVESNLVLSYYSGSKWRASWSGEWLDDGATSGNPEYYFQLDSYGSEGKSGEIHIKDTVGPSWNSGSLTATKSGSDWYLDWPSAQDYAHPNDSGLKEYKLWIDDNSNFSSPVSGYNGKSTGTTSSATASLSEGYYYWKVIAYDHEVNPSTVALGEPFGNRAPTIPVNIRVDSVDITFATIIWDASTDIDGDQVTYYVQYGKDWSWDGWNPSTPLSTDETSITISGLEEGKTYDVKIWAEDTKGASSGEEVMDKLFTTLEFSPSFADIRRTDVDTDGDGYAHEFTLSIDIASGLSGECYLELYEDDFSIFGLGDDWIGRTDNFLVNAGNNSYSLTIKSDDYSALELRGTAELKIELYESSTGDKLQTWDKGDDPDLGNIKVERSIHEQSLGDNLGSSFSDLVDYGLDWWHQTFGGKPVFGLSLGAGTDNIIDWAALFSTGVTGGLSAPIAALVAALNIDLSGSVDAYFDLGDILGVTQDGEDGWVTTWLGGSVALALGFELPFFNNVETGNSPLKVAFGIETFKTPTVEYDPVWDFGSGFEFSVGALSANAAGNSWYAGQFGWSSDNDWNGEWLGADLGNFKFNPELSLDLLNAGASIHLSSFEVNTSVLRAALDSIAGPGLDVLAAGISEILFTSLEQQGITIAPASGNIRYDQILTNGAKGVFSEQWIRPVTLDYNQAPNDVFLSNATVAENQPSGTTVGTFSTTDLDVGDIFTYTQVSGTGSTDNSQFYISGNFLKTNSSFNYEAKTSYSIRVRSTDQGGLYTENAFNVDVTNVNEEPTGVSLSSSTVAENQPAGTTVGTLSTTDPDAGNTFTYSLVSGDVGAFSIAGNTLKTADSFDYEARNSYSIRVRSTDQGGLYTEEVFTISVTNVNEEPTDVSLSSSTVSENQPSGTTVGTLSTTDPDAAGNTFTYSLVAGTGSADNGSFTIQGDTLKTDSSFNYEDKSSYSVRVRSTDQGGLSTEKVFTIGVTNVNEEPTIESLDGDTEVDEGAVANFNAVASDPDEDDLTYTWDFGDESAPQLGVDLASVSHIYADDGPYTVTLTVDDGNGGTANQTLEMHVANVEQELNVSGDSSVEKGDEYTLHLEASDPGEDTITGWVIDWGDGIVEDIQGNPEFVTHTYLSSTPYKGDFDADGDVDGTDLVRFAANYGNAGAGFTGDFDEDGDVDSDDLDIFSYGFALIGWDVYSISAEAHDEDGSYSANSLEVDVLEGENHGTTSVRSSTSESSFNESAESSNTILTVTASAPVCQEITGNQDESACENRFGSVSETKAFGSYLLSRMRENLKNFVHGTEVRRAMTVSNSSFENSIQEFGYFDNIDVWNDNDSDYYCKSEDLLLWT